MHVFASLVDPGLDIDLLPHWIAHYQSANLDRYVIALHAKDSNRNQVDQAQEMFRHAGWEHSLVSGEFRNGALQRQVLDGIRSGLGPDDVMVTPDSDEFHDCTNYREIMQDRDMITGKFEDRWDTTLHTAIPNIPLEIQYPLRGQIYEAVRAFCHGDENWDFPINQTKVLAFRNGTPVHSQGLHDRLDLEVYRRDEGHRVLHYSWRRGFARRMTGKTYHHPWYVGGLLLMFGVGPDDPERKFYEEWARKRQEERGWLPSSSLAA